MRTRTFLAFVAPSVLVMVALIAVPLVGVFWLSLHNSHVLTRLVEVKTEVPLFGGITQTQTSVEPQAVIGPDGRAVQVSEFVGGRKLYEAAEIAELSQIVSRGRAGQTLLDRVAAIHHEITHIDFWGALEFTLLYTFATTPLVLIIGLLLALGVNRVSERLKGVLIFGTMLPMTITPVVAALSIYWLFIDNAIISSLLEEMGFGRIYFLQDAITIRSIIIFYGIWNASPFAFIILYAGLQTVPRDTLESAMIDGASRWQRVRFIVIPHLMPLIAVITLIHLMDSYRVFEPVYVFGSKVYANSLQYLTYDVLANKDAINLAAAYAILTMIGIVVLLTPVLYETWREQRRAS